MCSGISVVCNKPDSVLPAVVSAIYLGHMLPPGSCGSPSTTFFLKPWLMIPNLFKKKVVLGTTLHAGKDLAVSLCTSPYSYSYGKYESRAFSHSDVSARTSPGTSFINKSSAEDGCYPLPFLTQHHFFLQVFRLYLLLFKEKSGAGKSCPDFPPLRKLHKGG